MINEHPFNFIYSTIGDPEKFSIETKFSPYANHKQKYDYMKTKKDIINIKDFFDVVNKNISPIKQEYYDKEHYLEIGNHPKSGYQNWADLPKELDNDSVVIDLGTILYMHNQDAIVFYDDFNIERGKYETLYFTYWVRYNDIYVKIHVTLGYTGMHPIIVKFYPNKLKIQPKRINCWLLDKEITEMEGIEFSHEFFRSVVSFINEEINSEIKDSSEFADVLNYINC